MKTIALLNIKGGVGKTATVTTIAHMLASYFGKKVIIVDLDPQGNTTAHFSNIDVMERLERKLQGKITSIDNSISDLLMREDMEVHDCVRHTIYKNLDIIPSDLQLGEVQDRIKADVKTPAQFRLRRHIKKLATEYDFCIMDCSPSVSIANVNGLAIADEVYIPTTPDGYSLEGVAYALDLINNVKAYNDNLEIAGCFFSRWENQAVQDISYQLLDEMVPGLLLPFRMYKSKLIGEGTYMNQPLLLSDRNRQLSRLTISYLHMAEYIMAEDKKKFLEDFDEERDTYLTVGQIENPEKNISNVFLEEVKNKGIQRPLSVRRTSGKEYQVIDGIEYYSAHKKLVELKEWDKYRPIPVRIINKGEEI